MKTRRARSFLAVALATGLTLSACGSDDVAEEATDTTSEASNSLSVTVSMEGVEAPNEVTGGIVDVTLETELDEAEVYFSKVAAGTTEDDFRNNIVKYFGGGPAPEFLQSVAGVAGDKGTTNSTITLPEGDYIVWSLPEPPEVEGGEGEGSEDAPAEGEGSEEGGGEEGGGEEGGGGPPPEAVLTRTMKVTPGEAGDLPEADGRISARDYTFDVEITGSTKEIVFFNDGPNEFHHAILFDFEQLDPKVVEENIPVMFASEDGGPPPEAFKDINLDEEGGFTAVFSPGLGGTSKMKIEEGNTYALVCFISDKSGGPPHAMAHDMYTVFKAGA